MNNQHFGFITIIGPANAGKSTLVNQLVGQKVSIISPKAQTTRCRLLAIGVFENTQLAFIDTPGIFKPRKQLDHALVNEAYESIQGVDATYIVIDVKKPQWKTLEGMAKAVPQKIDLVLNKIDLVAKEELLPIIERLQTLFTINNVFMISALKAEGVDQLLQNMKGMAKPGGWLYPEDEITNIPMYFWAAEITREQVFLQLEQELPYEIYVEPEKWEEFSNGSVKINQAIVVSRENYKSMVVGKKGQRIGSIGEKARKEMEHLLQRRVHLKLFVKVEERWQEKAGSLKALGIGI